jgi:hypothetical protein
MTKITLPITVHAIQLDDKIYAAEIDGDAKAIVTIFDVHDGQFVDNDPELEARILDFYDLSENILPPMPDSQWLHKKSHDVLRLSSEDFGTWVSRVKVYCCRRHDYCDKKYPINMDTPVSLEVMRDLYPHWTWYLCGNIKRISGNILLLRNGDRLSKEEAIVKSIKISSRWLEE